MVKEITFSRKVYIKLFESFKEVKYNWMTSTVSWLINSKYRTYKRLDYFLKDQIDNPDPNLVEIAETFKEYPYDRRIVEILKYVHNKIKYVSDNANYGMTEFWATAKETFIKGTDNCDGINGLIYVLARLSGIPAFKIFCTIGDVSVGGHFWVNYFSTNTDKLYVIDGTFYPDFNYISVLRQPFKISDEKYQKVWYMFNDYIIMRAV